MNKIVDKLPENAHIWRETFYVPTEIVIEKPDIYVPKVGRIYRVLRRDIPATEKEQTGIIDNCEVVISTKCIYRYDIYYELWENDGDDGHTDYVFSNKYILVEATNEWKVVTSFDIIDRWRQETTFRSKG
jgi:hypothetical protein